MLDSKWKHFKGLQLADSEFGKPDKEDLLFGVEVFIDVVRQGRRKGSHDSPTAIKTEFGWVLAGHIGPVTSHAVWEVEEKSVTNCTLTPEERVVLNHFRDNHTQDSERRFMVLFPSDPQPMNWASLELKLYVDLSHTVC